MGFVEANKRFFKNFFNFSGRARRSEYWWVQLSLFLIGIIGSFGIMFSIIPLAISSPEPESMVGIMLLCCVFIFLVSILLSVGSIALTVRRLHDTDRSGWFYFLAFIPWIGSVIILVFCFIEGTRGPNRFGPDPKAFEYGYNPNMNMGFDQNGNPNVNMGNMNMGFDQNGNLNNNANQNNNSNNIN